MAGHKLRLVKVKVKVLRCLRVPMLYPPLPSLDNEVMGVPIAFALYFRII